MKRRVVLLAIALGLASGIEGLGSSLVYAADPAHKPMRLGIVGPGSPSDPGRREGVKAFLEHLRELGWVEGQNLTIESGWAVTWTELPELMAEVIARKVDVLFTWTTPAAIAARNATHTTPIVNALMGDPVSTGLAEGLAHPGSNLTGLSTGWTEDMAGKWLELLQEMVPRLSTLAVIGDPERPMAREQLGRLKALATTRAIRVRVFAVRGPDELGPAFERAGRTAQAVLVLPDSNMIAHREQLTALAAKHRLPDMHVVLDYVDAGGLLAYAPDYVDLFRRSADYVDKILKGANPAELPIEQPNQYKLVVNLKTAKLLGLKVPESILIRADEVIR